MKKIITLVSAIVLGFTGFSQVYLQEDFSTFINPINPPLSSGWKNVDSLNAPPADSIKWRFDNPDAVIINSPIVAPFAICDGNWYGSGSSEDAYLESATFDASNATRVLLEFDHYFRSIGSDTAEIQVFNGVSWISDTIFSASSNNSQHEIIDISKDAAGVVNCQVRFRYVDPGWGWYWAIDNVQIYQPIPIDAAVVSVDSTVAGCGLDSNETVAARIVNVGTSTIRNFPINHTVNGLNRVTETVNDSILPGDTLLYTFTTGANLSAVGTYNIDVFTSIRADNNVLNDTASGISVHKQTISTFPYSEGFENGNGGWIAEGLNSTWAAGVPAGTVINSAANGLNAYVTNLSGLYNNDDASYIVGPCFDFTTLNAPQLKMNIWYESESSWDGAVLEMTIDNGLTWTQVGAFGNPNNWYNDNSINGLQAAGLSGDGWTVINGAGSGGWILAEHDLTGAANQPSVQLRIWHGSDGSVQTEGFAVDDILIQEAPATDGGVVSIVRPNTGCSLGSADSVEVQIINAGGSFLTNFPVNFELNNGATVTETYTDTIFPGDTVAYVFNSSTVNLSVVGSYTLKSYTSITNDGNFLNDTVSKTVNSIPVINSFPYNEGFETGNGGWVVAGTNSSFALGTPTGAVINSAANGIQAYVTNLSGNYNTNEEGWVTSPCFDLSTLTNPVFEANVWWNSEFSWDGAVLQSSTDGGLTWSNVGVFGDPNNWYTDNSINGLTPLATPQDGWTGRTSSSNGSNGWVKAEHRLTGLGGNSSVLLRMAFGSDGSINDEGFGFDDVVIREAASFDMALLDIVTPISGAYVAGMTDSVRIQLANLGSDTATNFTVNYSVNGGALQTETIAQVLPNDTIFYTFVNSNVPLPGPGTSSTLDAYLDFVSDSVYSNDSILGHIFRNEIRGIPYVEDFENYALGVVATNGQGDWSSNGTTNPLWEIEDALGMNENSSNTGPFYDNTNPLTVGGFYAYLETSGGSLGDQDTMRSPSILVPTNSGALMLGYSYHMFGADMGSLDVYIESATGVFTLLDSISGQQQLAGDSAWIDTTIQVPGSYSGQIVNLVFVGTRGNGYTSDVSIDDITLDFSVGLNNEIEELSGVSIFPNPSNGMFTLNINSAKAENYNLKLMDVSGKLVYESNLSGNGNYQKQLDFTSFAKGVYYLHLQTENESKVEKLIIK